MNRIFIILIIVLVNYVSGCQHTRTAPNTKINFTEALDHKMKTTPVILEQIKTLFSKNTKDDMDLLIARLNKYSEQGYYLYTPEVNAQNIDTLETIDREISEFKNKEEFTDIRISLSILKAFFRLQRY